MSNSPDSKDLNHNKLILCKNSNYPRNDQIFSKKTTKNVVRKRHLRTLLFAERPQRVQHIIHTKHVTTCQRHVVIIFSLRMTIQASTYE